MTERAVGYSLLTIGVAIIVFAAVNVFLVFTNRMEPIQFISQETSALKFNLGVPSDQGPGKTVQLPIEVAQILPLYRLINGVIHVVFLGFIAGIGHKIASLGVQLVRPIVVKAKSDK